jgi:uncharacterized protein YbjT (DUF2867 family)
MAKKLIAIVGATGAQGGGLARAILSDPQSEFAVRALTRKPDSDQARELARLGAEVVVADLDDLESLRAAFGGAHGAFCVTNFWEHMSPEKEMAQAKALAQACKAAGIEHAIWSTLEDTRRKVPLSDERMPTLKESYKVPHFDAKGASDDAFRAAGVPTTFLLTSFYWDNLISFGMGPKPGPDGKLAFVLPMDDKKLPGISVEDIGKCAYGIFKQGQAFIGKTVGIAGEHLTGAQMAEALGRSLGHPVAHRAVSPETYRSFGFPGADDLGNMFQYKRDFESEFCGARDVGLARKLNPELKTFSRWLEDNRGRISVGD